MFIDYLIQMSADAASLKKGWPAQFMYAFLNVTIPILLGLVMGAFLKIGEKVLRFKRKREN